jgi:hypothetical protein
MMIELMEAAWLMIISLSLSSGATQGSSVSSVAALISSDKVTSILLLPAWFAWVLLSEAGEEEFFEASEMFSCVWGARGSRQGMGGSGHGRDGRTTPPMPGRPERTSSGWVGWGKDFSCGLRHRI